MIGISLTASSPEHLILLPYAQQMAMVVGGRRRARWISQRKLAEKLQIRQSTISEIESGHGNPKILPREIKLKAFNLEHQQQIELAVLENRQILICVTTGEIYFRNEGQFALCALPGQLATVPGPAKTTVFGYGGEGVTSKFITIETPRPEGR